MWWLGYRTVCALLGVLASQAVHCAKLNTSKDVSSLDSDHSKLLKTNGSDVTSANDSDPNGFLSEYYEQWSQWSACSKRCEQSRKRACKDSDHCGSSWLKEKRQCKSRRSCSTRTYKVLGFRKKDRLIEEILYKLLYKPWTEWSPCTRSCKKRRFRACKSPNMCGVSYIQEERVCRTSGSSLCRKQYTLNTQVPINEVIEKNRSTFTVISNAVTANRSSDNSSKTDNNEKDGFQKSMISHSETPKDLTSQCGIRPSRGRGSYRIVGGHDAQKHSWPWQVAILEKWKEQFCGGTLIAPQWVLTAAHCIRKKKKKRKVFVRVGEHDIYAFDRGEEVLRLADEFPHPKYDFDTITNDIALLKLERPVTPSENVSFACLPTEEDEDIHPGQMCYIVGWGKKKNTHVFGSTILQEAMVPIVGKKRCQKVFDYDIHSSQVCAGYKKGGLDSCAGDSGGPLLCSKSVNGVTRWMVYGVTSYGEGCGEPGKFGIYTKVRKYRDWMDSVMDSN